VAAYAQTNLELLNQLCRSGYAEADLVRVRRAYEVALGLLTACFRPSGKTFLAHLVRTASILADLGTPPRVVVAGLLHAAYSHGEFGTSAFGISRQKRERLRAVVGNDAEDLIARYTNLPFGSEHLAALLHGLNGLGREEREVLAIRLANELEEHLDLGVLYCPNAEERRAWADRNGRLCVELAERLGLPVLASALAAAFEEVRTAVVPPALLIGEGFLEPAARLRLLADNSSFLLPPASYSMRPGTAVLRRGRAWVRRLRQAAARTRRVK
jgi:(p)ppGpp synthase/HD superfamily hydrolase